MDDIKYLLDTCHTLKMERDTKGVDWYVISHPVKDDVYEESLSDAIKEAMRLEGKR